jgi:glycosyltransferase involved in cell wall biosynthesis
MPPPSLAPVRDSNGSPVSLARPRVLHVYKDYYPPVLGGIETTINLMARGTLDEFDVSVLVCCGKGRPVTEVIDGVRVVRVGEWGRFASAPFSPAFPAALRREAAGARILHFHHPNPTGDVSWLVTRPRVPIVMTYHSDIVRQKWSMFAFGPVQERVMRSCTVIMPTSPNYVDSSPWLSRFRSKCRVLPLGIDLHRFDPTPETESRAAEIRSRYRGPIVLFVGRLRYYKGLAFLVRAMPQVEGTLVIGGTGPEMSRLKEVARGCQVAGRVHFVGELSESDLVSHLYAANVFCMPSHLRSEAFGLSQIEAMACGLPVVSTAVASGVPYVNRDGETGFCVQPESPGALAEALNRLLADPELCARMGAAARQRARDAFSAGRMCSDLKHVYRSVLDGVNSVGNAF